jgi:pyridoxine 5-phosphate synthase
MTLLSANLNKVALLRNTRTIGIPNVVHAARIALDAGAHGITVHPRPDGRHVRSQDVRELAAVLRDRPGTEFNIEGNPFHGLLEFVREVRPAQCTLVPDETGAFTSDHGWELGRDGTRLEPVIAELRALGVRVSLFMDPVAEAMTAAAGLGAHRIELIQSLMRWRSAPRSRKRCSGATRKPRAQRSARGWASTPVTTSISIICPSSCARCRRCWKCPSDTP